jgi:2-isopropylmalate synthase
VAEKRKGGFEDDELEALVSDQAGLTNMLWQVTGLQVSTGLSGIPTATVKMRGPDSVERYVACTGTGPVDAVYKAIDQIMGVSVKLESYSLNSVTEGINALATTRVVIVPIAGGPNDSPWMHSQMGLGKNRKFSGSGSDSDIITSSARAYTAALNKLLNWNMRRNVQQYNDELANSNNNGASSSSSSSSTTKDADQYQGRAKEQKMVVEQVGA